MCSNNRPRSASATKRRVQQPILSTDQARSILRRTAAGDSSRPSTAEPKTVSLDEMERDTIRIAQEAKAELKKLRLKSVLTAVAAAAAPSTSPWPDAAGSICPHSRDDGRMEEKDATIAIAQTESETVQRGIEAELQAVTEHERQLQQSILSHIEVIAHFCVSVLCNAL